MRSEKKIMVGLKIMKRVREAYDGDVNRAKEKIGFEKRESGFDNLEEDDSQLKNHEESVRGLRSRW